MILPELLKVVTYDEEIHGEGDRAASPPLRLIGVAAVVKTRGPGAAMFRISRPRSTAWPRFWARC